MPLSLTLDCSRPKTSIISRPSKLERMLVFQIESGSKKHCHHFVNCEFSSLTTAAENLPPSPPLPATPSARTGPKCRRSWSLLPCPLVQSPEAPRAAFPQKFFSRRKSEGDRQDQIGFCSVKASGSCLIYFRKLNLISPSAWQLFGIRSVAKERGRSKQKIHLQI